MKLKPSDPDSEVDLETLKLVPKFEKVAAVVVSDVEEVQRTVKSEDWLSAEPGDIVRVVFDGEVVEMNSKGGNSRPYNNILVRTRYGLRQIFPLQDPAKVEIIEKKKKSS